MWIDREKVGIRFGYIDPTGHGVLIDLPVAGGYNCGAEPRLEVPFKYQLEDQERFEDAGWAWHKKGRNPAGECTRTWKSAPKLRYRVVE
ncbi:MAG: hypothetical protein HKL82_08785 [Acidimicrobiaceae bacterium]|nr:hypothetical protein [Acidimicrobiaceae bacterium]